MTSRFAISKIGSHALPIQCGLLIVAVVCVAAKLGSALGWFLAASLLAGLVAFLCGIAVAFTARQIRWLGLSVAAALVAFFSLLIGLAAGGQPGV
jgi:hypothetical protein